ncbi:ExbD/TolR family protein [Halorhodospira neutriphila]|uniref:Biopolymer transporter ExbD n=1 Tax=Halorhodospira neutriphila TaxID=168379 RepID=A0ABS1E708_9GAMM|nr:biopolymer transporter ExbD [Halorhodospira neutriphila]MBK1727009.1 biopolymer transporter ExbD [Halorhodospira neutriphila]
MNLRRGRHREEPELNLAPLIDVVFLLLIFFMVTTTFVREAGLDITLPESSAARSAAPEAVEVSVGADGTYYVGEQALINRRPETLAKALREALEAGGGEQQRVVVRAAAQAPHQAVVRALDGVGRAGVERVSIATLRAAEEAD